MPTRTTEGQRRMFYALHVAGQTYDEIAARFEVSAECVRYWYRRQRDGYDCVTRYSMQNRGPLRGFDPLVRYCVLRLKLRHRRWGPDYIREHLAKRPSLQGLDLPSPASIGRYLHQWSRFRRPAKQPQTHTYYPHPDHAHEVWQLDFKVSIRFAADQWLHLHTVRDPVASTYIGAYLYAVPRRLSQVNPEHVWSTLRDCFQAWHTLPECIQTDGETCLVSLHRQQVPFPARFTLWLAGLGIEHRVIHQVTQNAEVERAHRTLYEYAILDHRATCLADLQAVLAQALHDLNYELPSRAHGCEGRPPVTAHPEVLEPRHSYQADHEFASFDLQRVFTYLTQFTWQRRADKNGVLSLGGRQNRYSIGRTYAHQLLQVTFDPTDQHFVFSTPDEPSTVLVRCPVKHLDVASLTGLNIPSASLGPQQLPLPFVPEGVNLRERGGV